MDLLKCYSTEQKRVGCGPFEMLQNQTKEREMFVVLFKHYSTEQMRELLVVFFNITVQYKRES